jgi:DNA (cytosine-5)-methyltransferase 1
MNIVDLFSGSGGLALGFKHAGFHTQIAIDFDQDSISTFNQNFKGSKGICSSIEDFNKSNEISKIKNVLGVVGGPPCQGFSSARLSSAKEIIGIHNKSYRNKLYVEFINSVKILDPKFFVMENVSGILSKNNKYILDDIYSRFTALGYDIFLHKLIASDYGVPQVRKRVFIIGIKNCDMLKIEFPKSEVEVSCEEAISDIEKANSSSIQIYESEPKTDYQNKMRENSNNLHNHEITHHSESTVDIISQVPDGGNIKSLPMEYWKIRKYNKAFQRMNSKKPSNTIDTGHRNYFHYRANRVPTVRESARLQSFPDDFIFCGSKTSQYKQVGNAVPPLLAYNIAKAIKNYI